MSPTTASSPPLIEAAQETRFAVVMYGGVSLAIYINGVAQELRRLVRATAAAAGGDHALPRKELTSTDAVYRKIAQLLPGDAADAPADDAPIRTRFVIDILSGTSAGGINALFLAKALVNDQSIASLKDLWIDEGDFGKLLHDGQGAGGASGPPASLLDGAHMYRKLLEALDAMDDQPSAAPATNVREMDLYITATDLHGLSVPLQLSDRVVFERRHRHAFQFRYSAWSPRRNDFGRDYNPFLAFAARCTSAFPFAFAPMRLCDIDRAAAPREGSAAARWQPFFADYLQSGQKAPGAYAGRPFADGGTLDNKPFGYAIDALLRRSAAVPVRRKLLYVEPSPERLGPEGPGDGDAQVDALQNVKDSVLTLPRYETIREDLQRVLARNRLVARLAHFTSGVERDLSTRYRDGVDEPPDRDDWEKLDLDDRIKRKGVSYGGYHRLKVAALTDEVAAALMKAAGLGPGTDYQLAFRLLTRAWREAEFVPYLPEGEPAGRKTENGFLVEFDVNYRLRRLTFVLGKLDRLWLLDTEAGEALRNLLPLYRHRGVDDQAPAEEKAAWADVCAAVEDGRWPWQGGGAADEFRAELHTLRTKLGEVLDRLYRLEQMLLGGDLLNRDAQLVDLIKKTGLTPRDLRELLGAGSEEACLATARVILDHQRDNYRAITDRLQTIVSGVTKQASADCLGALEAPGAPLPARLARLGVRAYYKFYEDFDLVLFPILYPDQVGEVATVDVVRVSPTDAEPAPPAPRLAGTALMNFGAFLRRDWRVNDHLWGRLDAAQRLIATLLPERIDAPRRQALIDEAHRIILAEDLRPKDRDQLYQLFAEALVRTGPGQLSSAAVAEAVRAFRASLPADASGNVLRLLLNEDDLLSFMRRAYAVDRRGDPASELRLLARAVRVTSQVAEGIARQHLPSEPRVAWMTRAGLIFWGVVEVLIPDSFFRHVATHFFKLLYLFALLLLAGGLLVGAATVWRLGLGVLMVTVLVHGAVVWGGDALAGRRPLAKAVRDLAVCGGVGFAAYGALHLLEQIFGESPLGWLGAVGSRDVVLVIGGAVVTGLVLLAAAGLRKLFGRGDGPRPVTAADRGRDRPG
jgi:patatin-related protein